MEERKTAGALSLECARDATKYNALDIGESIADDILEHLGQCIEKHNKVFGEDEYCVGYLLSKHKSLENVMVRNFFAMLFLPKPRPNQTVFRYCKSEGRITHRLWTLPNAATMAELSSMTYVDPAYKNMKNWCDIFFMGWKYDKSDHSFINNTPWYFFEMIRHEHGITMLSEREYLQRNREKLIQSCGNQVESVLSDALDPLDILGKKIVNTNAVGSDERILNYHR